MGQDCSSSSSELQQHPLHQCLVRQYDIVQEETHPVFGDITILRARGSSQIKLIYYFDQHFASQEEISESIALTKFESRPNFLVKRLHVQRTKPQSCHTTLVQRYYFQFIPKNLSQLVSEHRHQQRHFRNEQVRRLIAFFAEALETYHSRKLFFSKLVTQHILVDKSGRLKIADPQACNRQLVQRTFHFKDPLIMRLQKEGQNQFSGFNPYKSDLWSVGIILLEVISLTPGSEAYDFEGSRLRKEQMRSMLEEGERHHDKEVCGLVRGLLVEQRQMRTGIEGMRPFLQKKRDPRVFCV